ncbi:MAG: hypothetical protein C0P79_011770 [Gammaproteobacteria bacterium]|nr:hypothetical protein [Gammaproteobacteria bacterium]
MTARVVTARAPGKAVVLGEYAVLHGAPALVVAVDRRATVTIAPSGKPVNVVETRASEVRVFEASPGRETGVALVDLVVGERPRDREPWHATLDSTAFFQGARKLGLGSSAAVLTAFACAWAAWTQAPRPSREALIALHRRFQGGSGSGLDIAASLAGGAIVYRLDGADVPHVSSVQLPNGVGFAGVFAGRSASTPDLLARYYSWRAEKPEEAAARQRALRQISQLGCAAAERGESEDFLRAIDQYGRELDALGRAIGADIVTAEHRALAETARRFGVIYKVSGAGGGDLGLGLATDSEALAAFKTAAAEQGFPVVDLGLDRCGLIIEERAQ